MNAKWTGMVLVAIGGAAGLTYALATAFPRHTGDPVAMVGPTPIYRQDVDTRLAQDRVRHPGGATAAALAELISEHLRDGPRGDYSVRIIAPDLQKQFAEPPTRAAGHAAPHAAPEPHRAYPCL